MPRLRTVSANSPGWTRRRHGRGFRYLDEQGAPLSPEDVVRVKDLVIPPAWADVWICPHPRGHLQAVGIDAAGRRQYLYHPEWRRKRDEAKFDRVIEMAGHLPTVRRRLRVDMECRERPREAALAAAVRMVDLGCFRLGSDTYTEQNGSYGLTTLERRHLRRDGAARIFSFVGKAGVEHEIRLVDPALCRVLDQMTRRRAPTDKLLSARVDGKWVALQAGDVNDYIREIFGTEVTAKDFRTWHATVHVAVHLAQAEQAGSKTARAARVREAVLGASELLGNTPTVCRASYVDPRVIDLYEHGNTIATTLARLRDDEEAARDQIDRAVVRLLR